MMRHGIRHLVVVVDGRCIGVLEDRELFAQWPMGPLALRRTRIGGMLRARTTCVLPDSDLRAVASVMRGEHVDAVPVVDDNGALVGVVTGSDIFDAVQRFGLGPIDERDSCGS
jgi:acetoin utilization protein AcuB